MKHLHCAEYTNISRTGQFFKPRLKLLLQSDRSRRLSGNEFQAIGPPTTKARRPNVLRRNRGTVRKCRLADLRCCWLTKSETKMQWSTKYFSALAYFEGTGEPSLAACTVLAQECWASAVRQAVDKISLDRTCVCHIIAQYASVKEF